MKTSNTFLAFSSFLSNILALPTTTSYPTSQPPSWRITNYIEGCSPGGCVYSFNIASPSTPSSLNEPGEFTHKHPSPSPRRQTRQNPSHLLSTITPQTPHKHIIPLKQKIHALTHLISLQNNLHRHQRRWKNTNL